MNKFFSANPLDINKNNIIGALNALKQLLKSKTNRENLLSLNGNSQFITLLVGLKSSPEFIKSKHVHIKLPNSLYRDQVDDVCLFVKDPQKKWKEVINSSNIRPKVITKVIGVGKLQKKFSTYKDRRELCSGYDLFLADDRVVEKLPKLLGSYFIKTNKMPVALRLRESTLKNTLELALSSTFMSIRKGKSIGIRVARVDMKTDEIVDNIQDTIKQVFNFFTNKQKNKNWVNEIDCLYIQSTDTLSIPIWFKKQ
ncbi:hypothetical protein FG386_001671 [Cryptosporidium ryanae]|uniref:uncharacterized protein n=1 Tax=Cryptosporidium ryanae TaxID=515981 RepID=UPI00351A0C31|nr:hypothetical protein FG386_001671 [Cryptosporidium ryanae]